MELWLQYISNGVFDGLTKCTVAPAIDAFTKDCRSTVWSVVETITTIFCVYFRDTLSLTAVAATINNQTFDTLAKHFQLSMLKKLKIDNNNNIHNMQDQDETKQMEAIGRYRLPWK